MADSCDLLLKIEDSPMLLQFLHDCVDELTGIKDASFNNYNSDIEWTINDFNKAKTYIQNFYRQNILNEDWKLPSNLSKNLAEEITNCFNIRKGDIFEFLVKESLVKNGHNLVENFDWKLKWILGSSKLATIREPLLQLDLMCLKNQDKSARNTINCELNLERLDLLIEQLEKAKFEIKHE